MRLSSISGLSLIKETILNREILFGIRCAEVEAMEIGNWPVGVPFDQHYMKLDERKMELMRELASMLESITGAETQQRHSDHKGTYFCLKNGEDYFELRENIYPEEDYEAVEPHFSEYPFLLHISEMDDYPNYPHYLAAIEARPDIFVKLRTERY
jgi:hypothetical protein